MDSVDTIIWLLFIASWCPKHSENALFGSLPSSPSQLAASLLLNSSKSNLMVDQSVRYQDVKELLGLNQCIYFTTAFSMEMYVLRKKGTPERGPTRLDYQHPSQSFKFFASLLMACLVCSDYIVVRGSLIYRVSVLCSYKMTATL